jgi:hypothetical protein
MPPPKGVSGNPNGRPKGAKNKAPNSVKAKIDEMLSGSIDEVTKAFNELKGEKKVKYFIELAKIVIPRPRDPEEADEINRRQSELMDRLFPRQQNP